MNEKSLRALEYNKIAELLAGIAASPSGKAAARALAPISDIDEIRLRQEETTAAVTFILRKGSLPLGGIKEIQPSLTRADMGGTLSIAELSEVSDFIYVCRKVSAYGKREGKNDADTVIDGMFDLLRPAADLEKEITRCIINGQEIADAASERLAGIRRNIRTSGDRIKEHLNAVIRSATYKNMLQDAVITLRGGRYCVPVKQEYRGSFPGLVHDQSGSGSTLFIEPQSVVTLNNQIRELSAEEKNEIDRILNALTAEVAERAEQLAADANVLTALDLVFAKGELSLRQNATAAEFNEDGVIDLTAARHPLLPANAVVPTDIRLGKDFTTLLITGPNTGGKTVCLKTLGLFTLMGQAGLHIPARERSRLAVFDDVFADIGDEQSIEQSLSTFSGHMTNIVAILSRVTPNSLVLLDELGAGTDPVEGAAIARAVVEELRKNTIRTAVTTHYSELKVYALSTDGVENAACEFNVETLKPTYRLLIGVPGKSNAFAISRRLGLPEAVIDRAKGFLESNDERFEDIITDLEASKKTAAIEQDRAEQYRREAEAAKRDLEKQQEKLRERREKLLEDAKREARGFVERARLESDQILKDMQKMRAENVSFKELEAKRLELREKAAALEAAETAEEPTQRALRAAENLQSGDRVFVHTLNQPGVVASVDGAEALVQVGGLKLKVAIKALSLDDTPVKRELKTARRVVNKAADISPRLDLRGKLADEALEELDKYLDDAYLAHLLKVELIHGKGTGALRAAVQSYLKKHRYVKSYRLGTFGEGEDGVTIAELK